MSDETIILIPGHQIESEELPKMAKRMYDLAVANGFEVKPGCSLFQEATKEYGPKAQKAGEIHGGSIVENNWIDAVHRERKVKFTAVWHDGSFESAWWNTWSMVNSTKLNKLIKGEVE